MNTLIMNSCFLIHTLPLLKLHLNKIINYSRFLWVAYFLSIIPLQANTLLFSKDPCLDTDKPILLIKTGACNPALYDTVLNTCCLLYTSDAADERSSVDLGGRRIIKKTTKKTKKKQEIF